jgi:hypothetical protein
VPAWDEEQLRSLAVLLIDGSSRLAGPGMDRRKALPWTMFLWEAAGTVPRAAGGACGAGLSARRSCYTCTRPNRLLASTRVKAPDARQGRRAVGEAAVSLRDLINFRVHGLHHS